MAEKVENWYTKFSKHTLVRPPLSFTVHFNEIICEVDMEKCLNVKTLPLLTVEDFYFYKKEDMRRKKAKKVCKE